MIKGKPLPPVKNIDPPSEQEIDELIAAWDANAPLFYRGLLSAGSPSSRFDYDRANMVYIVRETGRRLSRDEVNAVFIETMRKIGAR